MFLFRADGNEKVGTGHIMRCLSIADSLKRKGEESVFVSADDKMKTLIEKRGYECIVLHTSFDNMEAELPALKELAAFKSASVVIIDSYYVTDSYFSLIGEGKKTVYIDDRTSDAFETDVLINYNVFADPEKYKNIYKNENIKEPEFILGPEYAPLRKEFGIKKERGIKENADNILIMTGGADPTHVAPKLAQKIIDDTDPKALSDIRFHFVIGSMSTDYEKMAELGDRSYGKIELHRNVTDMKSLMEGCDMAVSAAGSTLYELCACAVPTVTYVLADNQIPAEKAFLERGAMLSAGDAREGDIFYDRLYDRIKNLIGDPSERARLSMSAAGITDGKGAERIADKLIEMAD